VVIFLNFIFRSYNRVSFEIMKCFLSSTSIFSYYPKVHLNCYSTNIAFGSIFSYYLEVCLNCHSTNITFEMTTKHNILNLLKLRCILPRWGCGPNHPRNSSHREQCKKIIVMGIWVIKCAPSLKFPIRVLQFHRRFEIC